MGKIKFFGILFIGCLLCLISSCLNSDKYESEEWNYGNAQISSFALESGEYDLSAVRFTIDQLNNKIYNKDSLPFGVVFEEKVIATIGFDSPLGTREILMIEEATGDTVRSVVDSIDFSAPVMITVYAYDGLTTKTYEAKVNIHQVDPFEMIWEKYAEIMSGKVFLDMKMVVFDEMYYMYVVENGIFQCYKSDVTGVVNWEKTGLSGFPDHAVLSQLTAFEETLYVVSEEGDLYFSNDGQVWMKAAHVMPVKSLLGYLPVDTISGRAAVLCCIADIDGVLRFVTFDKQFYYTQGQVVPQTFPLTGFGQLNYETRYYPRLVVATGRDSDNNLSNMAWATMNGTIWASLSNPEATFPSREGSAITYYNNCFFIFGGTGMDGEGMKDIYFSIDQGVTWHHETYVLKEKENEDEEDEYVPRAYYSMPLEYEPRGNTQVFVDNANYILLFGGKARKDTNVFNEIWRGRINHLGFGKD